MLTSPCFWETHENQMRKTTMKITEYVGQDVELKHENKENK